MAKQAGKGLINLGTIDLGVYTSMHPKASNVSVQIPEDLLNSYLYSIKNLYVGAGANLKEFRRLDLKEEKLTMHV